jgi:peptidoglycan hydrolase-like protein with peptidoglycan-binding domain
MSPETRRAVWNFQKSEGFRLSGRLDAQTITALGLAEPPKKEESALAPESEPSASPSETGGARSPGQRDLQAP